jgi:hypothetical protein
MMRTDSTTPKNNNCSEREIEKQEERDRVRECVEKDRVR